MFQEIKMAAICSVSRSTAPEMLWDWLDNTSPPVVFVDGANVRAPV
jgi:hypothetical protein